MNVINSGTSKKAKKCVEILYVERKNLSNLLINEQEQLRHSQRRDQFPFILWTRRILARVRVIIIRAIIYETPTICANGILIDVSAQ